MSEFWGVVGFEIGKLSEEPGDLGDDSEEVVGSGVVMHLETLDGFVVFDDGVEGSFFKFLPVSAKIVFGVGVEEEKEILDIRDNLFQFEIISSTVELIGFLFKFSDRVGYFLQGICYFLVGFDLIKIVFFEDGGFEGVVFDHPQTVEIHEEGSEDSHKYFQLFRIHFCNREKF